MKLRFRGSLLFFIALSALPLYQIFSPVFAQCMTNDLLLVDVSTVRGAHAVAETKASRRAEYRSMKQKQSARSHRKTAKIASALNARQFK
ncbi:MAG TPA: hypothetical protein V6D17_01060 [Candidatus Obscuribacterales bacterium]